MAKSIAVCAHIVAAQPPDLCPMVENLEKFNVGWQHFLLDPVKPGRGTIRVDERPGLGLVIDAAKVERESAIRLTASGSGPDSLKLGREGASGAHERSSQRVARLLSPSSFSEAACPLPANPSIARTRTSQLNFARANAIRQ